MLLGYNTNGFAHHRLDDAVGVLAEIGYQSIAITIDHHVLSPYESNIGGRIDQIRELLTNYRMHSVIETGARFLLDARHKHHPTLMSPAAADRDRRVDFLRRAIDVAVGIGSDAVSFWSGALHDDVTLTVAMDHLLAGCQRVLEYAIAKNIRLAFEPEPGMFIERMGDFAELSRRINHPLFGLTIDIGHVHCLADGSIPQVIEQWSDRIFNIHIEDMRRSVHDHLMFGEGEIEFAPVLAKLREIGYSGGVHVELSRHSHDAVAAAQQAYKFLRPLILDPFGRNQ